MVPPVTARVIRLYLGVLNGHTAPNSPLQHSTPVQSSHLPAPDTQAASIRALTTSLFLRHLVAVCVHQSQVLACGAHGHVLTLQFALLGPAAFAQKQHPGAVDSPMSEESVAGEVQWAWCQRVRKVVADRC
jgi:hypothetical protein